MRMFAKKRAQCLKITQKKYQFRVYFQRRFEFEFLGENSNETFVEIFKHSREQEGFSTIKSSR